MPRLKDLYREQIVTALQKELGYRNVIAHKKPWCEGPYGRESQAIKAFEPKRNFLSTDDTARLMTEIVTAQCVSAKRSGEMMAAHEPIRPTHPLRMGMDWETLPKVIAGAGMPLIAKGVTHPDDARRLAEMGFEVIYISNHGGHALDHGRGAIDYLPDIVAAYVRRMRGKQKAPTKIPVSIRLEPDVVAALRAIALNRLPLRAMAIVPAAENMPGGRAIRPGDVLRGASGITVEVNNTDAEGRLILGDALWYARQQGATHLVDVATLTGAIVVALGKITSGIFGTPDAWVEEVRRAGDAAGDLMWALPVFDEYREQLKSVFADIQNIGTRYGGAITAAMFLTFEIAFNVIMPKGPLEAAFGY